MADSRRDYAGANAWLHLDPAAVTADTPVPFDLHQVWHRLAWENGETIGSDTDSTEVRVVDEGDANDLRPAQFVHHGAGSALPNKGAYHGVFQRAPELLRLALLDPRMRFFLSPTGAGCTSDPLVEVINEWIGADKPLSILDFSGVPSEAADLAIGVVIDLIFEVALRSETEGIGRPRPVLIVLEEAHRYLGDEAEKVTRNAVNRIAREGRKYGVGLMLVTQRPSELPDTALAQCGTLIALRLSNSSDQGKIKAALPDTGAGLAAVLPSLRTGEAVVSGEAIALPTRMMIDLPDPQPRADDPSLSAWRKAHTAANVGPALERWRGIYQV